MAVYLTLTLFVVALSLVVRKKQLNNGRVWEVYQGMTRQDAVNLIAILMIFTALFAVSALRLNVGNDYAKYVEFMHLVYSHSYVPTEAGFNGLTYAVYYLCGFENYILVFALFAFFTIFFFMKAIWQQSEWFAMSFAMFMLLCYYFQSISTVRYYLALGMALYAVKFVIRGDWPRFILVVLVAALFHKSVLVVLPLYFLASIKWKKWMMVVAGAFCISCLFLQDLYLKIVVFLYPSYKDTEYLTGGTSYVNIARCAVILVFSLFMYRSVIKDNRTYSFYFWCNNMALALYVFGSFLPIISRIGYYLTVTHIFFVPAMVLRIKDSRKRQAVMVICGLTFVLYFAMYMRGAASDGVRILPYQTFLFNEMPMTLSERGY